ncbi:(d)CMP kinase [Aquibacillus sp. 3ASR75-11]|uniref:Cytidylate kinase n=1 Tax=Terrihalobacillus insolitus TaxID=2950438 RepID=A0A9X4ANS1_9BACI|nr:(d)CMP kinase [Terrihalobacillus insolitus]MDC3413068.1 (d)CMP kinase [Terrihalobacillus insolitus]MDC3424810.1 (d)CMP kinase [Terrihalobacillus insolitus]
MGSEKIAIAIDGPAAAGKSTVAKKVAEHLSYIYIDTGAMYRALTYYAIKEKLDLTSEKQIIDLLFTITIKLIQGEKGQNIFVNDQDVTQMIRSQEVTNHVSIVAQHPLVRAEMVHRQKALAVKRGVVMDGRDIGTHVIPDAEVKIFLVASALKRAERRQKENEANGIASNLEKLKMEIEQRDQLDSEREASPLVKAKDAVEIDTTTLTIDEVVHHILNVVEQVRS